MCTILTGQLCSYCLLSDVSEQITQTLRYNRPLYLLVSCIVVHLLMYDCCKSVPLLSLCMCLSVQSGGDLNARDGDGYTPLSILNEDRVRFKSSLGKCSHNVQGIVLCRA